MRFGVLRVASLTALVVVTAFIVFSSKNESSEHNASMASSSAPPPSKDKSPSLDSIPKGNVVTEQYGAVICPDPKTFDAFDAASIRALTLPPDLAAIWSDTAEPNGCNYIRSGTSLVSEGETNDSGNGSPLAIVTATMPDGTTIRGVTLSSMLYSIPKGNVVANQAGAVICPDSKDVDNYKDAASTWVSNNKPNMSAEEFRASVEGSAKSAGCNYVLPGTSLVSEGGIEGGHGYGANLNLIVTAKMPDGTTIRGVTLPVMITPNQQQPMAVNQPTAAEKPRSVAAQVAPIACDNSAQQANAGFRTYANCRYGFRVDYPESFVPQQPPENGDGLALKSEDGKTTLVVSGGNNAGFTLKDEFDRSIREVKGQLGFNKMGGNWFVVTWTDGDNLGYTKEFVGRGSKNSFTITYPVEQRPQYDSAVTKIEKAFKPGDLDNSH
ncbi:MAG: hypothetical protein ABSD64_07975 [Terriglobales bacterium]|jgi:hypothetical protein